MSELVEQIWSAIREEAALEATQEPALASFFNASVINHKNFSRALAFQLAGKIASDELPAMLARDVVVQALSDDKEILEAACLDLQAYLERDPACNQLLMPFLYFKGYQAIQLHRISHFLWNQKRTVLARYFQSRCAEIFAVDVHPAVHIGHGFMLDHATGLVVGETSRIGCNVSALHQVTLGGSGTGSSLRHPQIGDGVLLAAGATLLGPVEIGDNAKVAAGSLVLESVPAYGTVAGVPATLVSRSEIAQPSREMDQTLR